MPPQGYNGIYVSRLRRRRRLVLAIRRLLGLPYAGAHRAPRTGR